MDLGYITHAVHANVRMVVLLCRTSNSGKTLTVTGPPSASIYPPGPGFLYLIVDGVPSAGRKVMIGDGKSPPTDEGAIAKCVIMLLLFLGGFDPIVVFISLLRSTDVAPGAEEGDGSEN
jgi:Galactose oxidase-like, Early set domain